MFWYVGLKEGRQDSDFVHGQRRKRARISVVAPLGFTGFTLRHAMKGEATDDLSQALNPKSWSCLNGRRSPDVKSGFDSPT